MSEPRILVVVDGVTVGELFPVDFFNMAVGEAAANVDKVRLAHAEAGGPGAYLDMRPVMRLMREHQRQFYIDAASKPKIAAALRDVPIATSYEGVVSVEEPWEPAA